MIETPNPPNLFVYSENRQTFTALSSIFKLHSSRLDNGIVESRELHVTAVPQSKDLKRKFDSVIFRLVENTNENPTDRNGNSIVGGVNTYPEPVHVVLFVTPAAIAMLSQRASVSNGRNTFSISICPGVSILEWDQSDSIPIYEFEFHC